MKRSPAQMLAERESVAPPEDLSDMPSDPRWVVLPGVGWRLPPRTPAGVGLSCGSIEIRQQLDWWRLYGNAADAVIEIERRLKELSGAQKSNGRAKRQRRPATPSASPATPPAPAVAEREHVKPADAVVRVFAQAAMWEH